MNIEIKTFNELSTFELYRMLQLRSEVFIMEQHCVYQDMDGKDLKALHILGKENGEIVAYARAFKGGDYFDEAAFGRVLVQKNFRKKGYGHEITKASIGAIKKHFDAFKIRISAQLYLLDFYRSHGFEPVGKEYMEENIPHIAMILELKSE